MQSKSPKLGFFSPNHQLYPLLVACLGYRHSPMELRRMALAVACGHAVHEITTTCRGRPYQLYSCQSQCIQVLSRSAFCMMRVRVTFLSLSSLPIRVTLAWRNTRDHSLSRRVLPTGSLMVHPLSKLALLGKESPVLPARTQIF